MQTIGERLEEARKKKGLSIREAAEATKIRGDYLQKFESNHFDIGLAEIYTRGFLRNYSNYLKLPADRILNDYASLGRGEVRPRQPSREIYGRMDITVASAGDPAERGAAPEAAPHPEPSHANRGPNRPRPGSSLPSGPDPAVVFRYVKWGGIAVVGLVAVLVVWSLLSGGSRPAAKSAAPAAAETAATARTPSFAIFALRPVQVRITRVNPDNSDGETVFAQSLSAGDTRSIPRAGALYIEATPPDGLEIEVNGRRLNWGQQLSSFGPGLTKGLLPAP